jgi:hypothetical protein
VLVGFFEHACQCQAWVNHSSMFALPAALIAGNHFALNADRFLQTADMTENLAYVLALL